MYRSLLIGALGLVLTCAAAGLARAADRGDAMRTARGHHQALLALADAPGGRAQVEARLAELIDAEALAAAVIGDRPATAEQRRRLGGLLGRLAAVRYRQALMQQRGRTIARVDASEAPDGGHRIKITTGPSSGKPPTTGLDFVMSSGGGGMRVTDVYTDGVGLVENYKRMMKGTDPMKRVIVRLERELGDPPGPPAPAPPSPPPASAAPPASAPPAPDRATPPR